MKKIIHRLNRRSEEDRRHVLHIVVFVLTIGLIVLWVFSLSKNLSSPETKARMKEDLTPFSILKDNIINDMPDNSVDSQNN